jgi:hypothetical protein
MQGTTQQTKKTNQYGLKSKPTILGIKNLNGMANKKKYFGEKLHNSMLQNCRIESGR